MLRKLFIFDNNYLYVELIAEIFKPFKAKTNKSILMGDKNHSDLVFHNLA